MKTAYFGMDLFHNCFEYIAKHNNIEIKELFTDYGDGLCDTAERICGIAKKYDIKINDKKATDKDIERLFMDEKIDFIISAYYPHLIPVSVQNFCGINIHPGYLPDSRGAWPQTGVLKRKLPYGGVTIHKIAEHFDTGDILMREKIAVSSEVNIDILNAKYQMKAFSMLKEVIRDFDYYYNNAEKQGKGEYWNLPSDIECSIRGSMSVDEAKELFNIYGQYGTFVEIKDKRYVLTKAEFWHEHHNLEHGTVVIRNMRDFIFALRDGFAVMAVREDLTEYE